MKLYFLWSYKKDQKLKLQLSPLLYKKNISPIFKQLIKNRWVCEYMMVIHPGRLQIMLQWLADHTGVLYSDGRAREELVSHFSLKNSKTYIIINYSSTLHIVLLLFVLNSWVTWLTSSSANTERLKNAPRKDSLWISLPVPGLRGSGHHNGREMI